jgi:pimeloyl-ACP methyl ester carboxylesterase
LIEHVSAEPVHVARNSYGANVTLTLLTQRPDLVDTAAVHEPPLVGLLEGTRDQVLTSTLSALDADLTVVGDLIRSGDHGDAAECFVEHVALGPGTWSGLTEAFRSVLEGNAPTYLDELADQTGLSIDTAALATTKVPLLLTYGTTSPAIFPAVINRLAQLLPAARVEVLEGAGHIPHATHPHDWLGRLVTSHDHHSQASLQ